MVKCKFLNEFLNQINEFYDPFDIEDPNPDSCPDKNGIVKLCCCRHEIPHDESIKFILNGTEEAKDTILFENRHEGDCIIEADVNYYNKLP